MSEDELNPYQTSDTPLAAYLHMKGMVVLSTKPDPDDPKRIAFIFLDESERPAYVDQWFTSDRQFSDFYKSYRELQRLIFTARERENAK